jgi:hypothetical protein
MGVRIPDTTQVSRHGALCVAQLQRVSVALHGRFTAKDLVVVECMVFGDTQPRYVLLRLSRRNTRDGA